MWGRSCVAVYGQWSRRAMIRTYELFKGGPYVVDIPRYNPELC